MIKNYVIVAFDGKFIKVDDRVINDISEISIDTVSDELPQEISDKSLVTHIEWRDGKKGDIACRDGQGYLFDESKYNALIQPYVDLWQVYADKEDQAQTEAEAEQNKFENRQSRALTQLNADFETAADRAHVVSSLGFTVDANGTANENVNGLLVTIGDGTVQFCDYYNQFHTLNKAQLENLRAEIIQNGQNLYAQKWQYRTAIEDCVDNEGLDAVVATIEFTYMDFSTAS